MKKKIILEKKQEYLKACRDLKRLRPTCHFVSAISTICFVVVWCVSREFAKPWIEANPYLVYSLILIGSVPAAFYFEKIVSGVINTFALIFADRHGWQAVAGIGLVLAPIFFVAASTSFVGFKSTITQTTSNENIEHLSGLAASMDKSNQKMLNFSLKKESNFIDQRNNMRDAIEKSYKAKIKKANKNCRLRYNEFKTNSWHKQKLDSCQNSNQAEFEILAANELLKFDKETQELLEKLSDQHSPIAKTSMEGNASVLEVVKNETTQSINRINWLGGFFGFGAVIALFVSLFAAVMEKQITNILIEKKRSSLSPTLSNSGVEAENKQKTSKNIPFDVDRRGEDVLNELVQQVEALNAKRLKGDLQSTIDMHEAIAEINKLGYGVYFEEGEREFTIKQK